MENKHSMGVHILGNFFDCPGKSLKRVEKVKEIALKTVKEASLSMIKYEFHQFQPEGVTGFILLGESHLSIHTWPEHKSVAIDIFCCFLNKEGRKKALKKAEDAYSSLLKGFMPGKHEKRIIQR